MFTWICPRCGREVPPAYNECPDCAALPKEPAAAAEGAAAAPEVRRAAPPRRAGLPTWLLTILFALAFVGIGSGVYWTVGYFRNRPETKPSAATENPAAKPGAAVNPIQKNIEVSGVRFATDPNKKSKLLVKFVITNHSPAEISGLAGNVTIWGNTRKSEEDAQGSFAFNTSLGPYESRELSAPLATKLKIFELPDWQNVTPDIQITAPAAR